jgi:signal transduction histidine kinase
MWWTGVLLSLSVGLGFYALADNTVDKEGKERFRHLARNAQFNINASIKAYTEVLRGTASHFHAAAPEKMTRESFHRYVQGLDLARTFPAVDSISFASYFTDAERPAHEARMRELERHDTSYPAYQIKPAGRRPEYAVLTMIEPLDQFSDFYGRDLAARPKLADILFSARDNGTMSSSGQPIPLHRFPNDVGMAMRIPIYRNRQPAATVQERRAACIGSVGLSFNVQRLVNAALGDMSDHEVRVVLHDGGLAGAPLPPDRPGPLLYDSHAGMPPTAEMSFSLMLPIQFNGRLWQASFVVPRSAMYSRFDAYLPLLAASVGFGASMLIYALFMILASSRRRALRMARAMTRELRDSQTKLQLSHHRLRRLAAHADQIKEAERKRIAREIHDDLGQNLLVLRIEVDILVTRTAQRHPRLHARAQATLRQIDDTIRSVRNIINDLRPNVLDLGLGAAVEWQVAQFRQRSGIVCELVEQGADVGIDDHCAIAFFRVLQESLSNIYQHAHASLVRVELRRSAGMLRMTISDNGVGIRHDGRNKTGSFGLVGIEERISLLGGHCSIISNPDSGTTVTVSVPLSHLPEPSPAMAI